MSPERVDRLCGGPVKTTEARRVAEEYVLPLVDEEAVLVRRLVVLQPVLWLVRGFSFGSSTSSRTDFFVHAITDALYSPEHQAPGIPWVRSPRLIYQDGLNAEEVGMLRTWLEAEGVPLLKRIRSPGDLADDIERRQRGYPYDLLKEETRAYSLIVAGRDDEARTVLRHLLDAHPQPDDLLDYERETRERARAMLERLEADRDTAVEVMREWRRAKATEVGVTELLAPLAA
jgi:hypothetical protein